MSYTLWVKGLRVNKGTIRDVWNGTNLAENHLHNFPLEGLSESIFDTTDELATTGFDVSQIMLSNNNGESHEVISKVENASEELKNEIAGDPNFTVYLVEQ